jgi:hypothetical protein
MASSNNSYFIRIEIPIAFMPINLYEQWATLSSDKRLFYFSRGGRGVAQVSVDKVTILACGINLWKK